MSQIDTTKTWLPGDSVDAAGMNNIIDQATAEDALITGQTVLNTVEPAEDYVLIIDGDAVAPKLRKTLVSNLQAGVTSVGLAMPNTEFNVSGSPVTASGTLTAAWKTNIGAGKVLAAPAASSGTPSFRVLSPADLPNTATDIPAYAINCELGNVFKKTLPDNVDRTFTFTAGSGTPGQRIMVYVQQHSATGTAEVHWVAGSGTIQWPGGTEPVMSTGASHRDIFEFICLASNSYFGIRWGANFLT